MSHTLDSHRFSAHRTNNQLQTALLLGLMSGYATLTGWVLWGADGLWILFLWAAVLLLVSPALSSRWVLGMYKARPLPPEQASQYHQALAILSGRANLPQPPTLWWVPSPMVNAFAVGSRNDSAVAVTDGLLRNLSPRELVAVLAHETAHIAHGDLTVMGLADAMSRITSAMSLGGLFLILFSLPQLLGGESINWWAILLLAAAPQASFLAQLGLSRTREFDADLTAALLTNDPEGLASALVKLETIRHHGLRRILFPGQGVPEPSWLRTHPTTKERLQRLLDIQRSAGTPVFPEGDFPPPLFPRVRVRRAPRGGYFGYWF